MKSAAVLPFVLFSGILPAAEKTIAFGTGEARRVLSSRSGETTLLHLGSVEVPAGDRQFRIVADGRTYTAADFRFSPVQSRTDNLTLEFTNDAMRVTVLYSHGVDGALRKRIRIQPERAMRLEQLDVETIRLAGAHMHIPLTDSEQKNLPGYPICAFVQVNGFGGFFSLDFAFSDVMWKDGLLAIGYQPYVALAAGEVYESHAVTFQAYRLAGRKQGDFDIAEADAFRRYLRYDYAKPHSNNPQFFYTSIVNRFTEVDASVPPARIGETPIQNTIFYTLSDANYYMLHPEKMFGEIDFCKSLSMDICQLYEGPFEWLAGNPPAALARRIGEYGRDRGVKLGLYTGANQLTAPHFNHYGQDKGKPEWKLLSADGKRGAYCWGSSAFADWFTDTLIEASRNFHFQNANFDFLKIAACHDPAHGHALGAAGVYRQVANLVHSLDTVRAAVPGYVYDSNLGWAPFVPKIAASMDAFYLTDPHFTTYFPTLNTTEQLDNSRRFQMVSYFIHHLTPVEYFRNCEYFVVPDSVLPDSKMFEFGILQGLAVTPNLQLGEARALFDRMSPEEGEKARRFLARWTAYVRDNFPLYGNTIVLTGLPHVGTAEVYAHAGGGRSIVFLVNPNPFTAPASFSVGEEIGLSSGSRFLMHELYPEDRLLSGTSDLTTQRGERKSIQLPARSVTVLEVSAPPEYTTAPLQVAGAPASYDRFADDYRVTVEGQQGETRAVRLYPPPGVTFTRVESGGEVLPLSAIPGGYQVPVRFPKESVDPQIRSWEVQAAGLSAGTEAQLWKGQPGPGTILPQIDSSKPALNFLGARIENLLNERYSRELNVFYEARTAASAPRTPEVTAPSQKGPTDIPPVGRELWYRARFPVAYVQSFIPPAPGDHNYISLNFADPGKVGEIKAWLNGAEVPVETFPYWRGPKWAKNFYVDGTRHGLKRGGNTLTLFVHYTE